MLEFRHTATKGLDVDDIYTLQSKALVYVNYLKSSPDTPDPEAFCPAEVSLALVIGKCSNDNFENNITEIKAFAFKGLRDMLEISVQNNPIKILSSFAFAGIRNVSSLMLGHNQLSVIEESAFAATEMIQMLILNNNPIKVSFGAV